MNSKIIRRHKKRTDDGKGLRRMIAGRRFRLPAGLSSQEADRRFGWIEELWTDNESFCKKSDIEIVWTDIALWAAESFRKGERRVPVPPIDEILPTFEGVEWPDKLRRVIDDYTDDRAECHYPPTLDGFASWKTAKDIFDVVSEAFPSVPWGLPETHRSVMQEW